MKGPLLGSGAREHPTSISVHVAPDSRRLSTFLEGELDSKEAEGQEEEEEKENVKERKGERRRWNISVFFRRENLRSSGEWRIWYEREEGR